DLLPARARRAATPVRPARRLCHSTFARHGGAEPAQGAGAHGISARRAFPGGWKLESQNHRPAGLGRAALDVGSELLHRARARAWRGQGRRAGRGTTHGGTRLNPIHPALARLARAAEHQDFAELEETLHVALRKPTWLRPEHRVGDPNGYMRHLLYIDPDDAFVVTAITWLPGQVSP